MAATKTCTKPLLPQWPQEAAIYNKHSQSSLIKLPTPATSPKTETSNTIQNVITEIFTRLAALQEMLTSTWRIDSDLDSNIAAISVGRRLFEIQKRALLTSARCKLLALERSTLNISEHDNFQEKQTLIRDLRTLDGFLHHYGGLVTSLPQAGRQPYRSPLELIRIRNELITKICVCRKNHNRKRARLAKLNGYIRARARQFAAYFKKVLGHAKLLKRQCAELENKLAEKIAETSQMENLEKTKRKLRHEEREKLASERAARLSDSGHVISERFGSAEKLSDRDTEKEVESQPRLTSEEEEATPAGMKKKRHGLESEFRLEYTDKHHALAQAEKAIDRAQFECVQIAEKLDPMRKTVAELEDALEKARSATYTYRTRMESKVDDAENMRHTIEDYRQESRALQDELTVREDEFDALVIKRDQMQRQIEAEQKVLTAVIGQIKQIDDRVSECDTRRRRLNDKKRELHRNVVNAEARTTEMHAELSRIRTVRMELVDRKQLVDKQIDELREETDKCEATITEFDSKLQQIQPALTAIRDKANVAAKQAADRQIRVASTEAHEEQLKMRLEEVLCVREQYKGMLVEEQRLREERQDCVRQLYATLQDCERQENGMQREIQACQAEQLALCDQLNRCCKRMWHVRDRNERLRINLDVLKNEPLLPPLRLDEPPTFTMQNEARQQAFLEADYARRFSNKPFE